MKDRNILANSYVKNVLAAVVILIILIVIVLQGLNVYTHHGKQVVVPDVKGLQVGEAGTLILQHSLQYAVVDSIYVRNKPAGSILETVPPMGTNVKEGRTIYLTINTVTARMVAVPQVTDMSQRQAEAVLRSLGFETIRIRTVPGAYRELVTGLETTEGATLIAGRTVPVNTTLILLVGSGQTDGLVPDGDAAIPAEDPEAYLH
jgi:beta-lactam-binding protein with PASTA domain